MKITLSKHALENARERGITLELIQKCIEQGAKHLQGQKIVSDYSYARVVYRKIKDEYFIITVMVRKGD
ncbi:MAG TPA: DUF4258 domain-containing protein [Candidatus Nanoarchaeia archaeon]|nr:DUF4258 domain-containing protein [Candidatus Nanoarchaeia archaeon]